MRSRTTFYAGCLNEPYEKLMFWIQMHIRPISPKTKIFQHPCIADLITFFLSGLDGKCGKPAGHGYIMHKYFVTLNTHVDFNPLNAELNPIRHLLALVGARHIVHVSRIRVKTAHSNNLISDNLLLSNKHNQGCGEERLQTLLASGWYSGTRTFPH